MTLHARVLQRAHRIRRGVRQLQEEAVLIRRALLIQRHAPLNHRQYLVPHHTDAPDQLRARILLTEKHQEIPDPARDPLHIFRMEVTVLQTPKLMPDPGLRNRPCRLIKRHLFIGAQVDDDRIRLPGSEVILLLRPRHHILRTGRNTADLGIDRRHHIAHIVFPVGYDAPAAL